jgi:sugar phosphate isomerase/epimerase
LENVEWSTYNRVGVFKTLSTAIPNLRGVLDIKQARISEYPYEEYIKDMGERLAYAHISDYDKNSKKMCLPGKGDFDFDTFVSRLQDVGFDGALLIEVYENDFKEEKELKIACDYVDEILYKHGCLKG